MDPRVGFWYSIKVMEEDPMHYTERDRRLCEILESYGATGDQFLGLHSAIEDLMDEDRADAYEDGMAAQRDTCFPEF
jgi:hypothetical protein